MAIKSLWRSFIFCSGLLVCATTPVLGDTSSKQHATSTVPTNVASSVDTQIQQSPEYQSAYIQGQREAQDNIALGKPSIYTVGKPGSSTVDEQTGLPLVSIAGCVVDDSIMGRKNGYNDRIREWAAVRSPVESSQF